MNPHPTVTNKLIIKINKFSNILNKKFNLYFKY